MGHVLRSLHEISTENVENRDRGLLVRHEPLIGVIRYDVCHHHHHTCTGVYWKFNHSTGDGDSQLQQNKEDAV